MAPRPTGVSGAAVGLAALGVYLVYAGIRNVDKPFSDGLRALLRGTTPQGRITLSGPDTPISAPTTGPTSVGQPGGPITRDQTDLVPNTSIRVWKGLVPVVTRLINDARAAGINLDGGGWRSREDQVARRMANGCPDVYSSPSSSCRVPTAIPGRSRHEWGLAIDFTTFGHSLRSGDRAFSWLKTHAASYGLHNLPSEPWHWSTDGH